MTITRRSRTEQRRAIAKAVGQRIRNARRADGRSVDDLAAVAGVARATWYAVEAGTRSGDALTRQAMATALDIDPATLFAPVPVAARAA